MSEFNWWLLIVGLVIGAGIVWLILADSQRRESEISQTELPAEAAWIAATLEDSDQPIDAETAERVLRLHKAYLASPPPDEVDDGAATPHDEREREVADAPRAARPGDDQELDAAVPGTTPVWSATDPSPRRR
jgi:hypothetical protein